MVTIGVITILNLKVKVTEIKHYQLKEYLNKIRPYLKDITDNLKKSDTWKIQLTIAINLISPKDNDKEHVMHSKSNNVEILINDKPGEVIEELFQLLLSKHHIGLETSMKGSKFVFHCVHLLYYIGHKTNPNHGGSYMDSPEWIKNKKATINKKDIRCFQYIVTVALNHEEEKKITKNNKN